MTDDIYDPLDEYVNTFQPRFEQEAKDTFAQLAKEAQVDVDANRQTSAGQRSYASFFGAAQP